MCKDCTKEGKCSCACVALMRIPKKDLTAKEWELIRTYEKISREGLE